MKKALIVIGTTAALLASVLAPTTGFAAAKSSAVKIAAEHVGAKMWVKDILSKDYYFGEKNVPKTYFYVRGEYAGTLDLVAIRYDGSKKLYGVYQGWLYKQGPK
ncbi:MULTISPECIES: hypothetical protein [Paenibacillus]|uniref:Uncharacterized protein n=1 Tax=Paenibacillus alvei TaxID=44250 RepID=A0ABT4EGN1_PAEAL|nr:MULTISPECIES: hypothetical protein [Paenibacillus]EPY13253.1 hypothetical protein PAAL66ix_09411 [Paenibacillus alvei A6-6i-x]MCY9532903.1 hypothetical protein [Paenibacillus alvei]